MKNLKLFFICVFSLFLSSYTIADDKMKDSECIVHYINVGQGDATLLEFSCGAILIDAGAQDQNYLDSLLIYLGEFFDGRPYLGDTLQSVMITHDHPDHIMGLREVIDSFYVKRLIYNGIVGGRGDLNWAVGHPDEHEAEIISVSFEDVIAGGNMLGLTNNDIDPICCGAYDPVITVLSGGFESNPGWSHSNYDNDNNQSLVIRLDFREHAFIFTGDLEDVAIEKVLQYYYPDGGTEGPFDIDVYHVGHHGSDNGTTKELLDVMSPEVAVIPVGDWTYGKDTENRFSTYWYGHPRRDIINMLENSLPGDKRSTIVKAKLASKPGKFRIKKIRKRIYATAWDGNIKIKIYEDGHRSVLVNRRP